MRPNYQSASFRADIEGLRGIAIPWSFSIVASLDFQEGLSEVCAGEQSVGGECPTNRAGAHRSAQMRVRTDSVLTLRR